MVLDWVVVVAVARGSWPWPYVLLKKYTVRAVEPERAESEACKAAIAEGYTVVNSIAASCTLPVE